MRLHRDCASGGSSSQTPSDASLCIRSAKPIARRKACALGASRNSSPRRKRQVSSVPLLVLSKLQTLRWFAIWFRLSCQKKWAKRGAGERFMALTRRFFSALFGRKADTFPIAYGSDECTTRICGQTASISVLLISGILGRLRFCTIGEFVDGLLFPRQRVLPSPYAATAPDGSVVTTQAAL